MITSSSDGLAPLGVSPVRGNSKHSGTPLKFSRRKTSRKDQATGIVLYLPQECFCFDSSSCNRLKK